MYLLRNILSISLFEEEKVLNLILQSISTSAYKDLATKTLEAGTLQVSKIDENSPYTILCFCLLG